MSLLEKLGLVRPRPQERGKSARSYTITNPYHAVSISAIGANACEAAKLCAGKRYLSADAPRIPMKECSSAQCRCRYQHHDDRRIGPRRANEAAWRPQVMWNGADKRAGRGRRVTDH